MDEKEVKQDETVPGGAFLVGGRMVDANGVPLETEQETPETEQGNQADTGKTLEDFTVPQLVKAADVYAVNLQGKTLKADIIQALVDAEVSPEDVEAAQA